MISLPATITQLGQELRREEASGSCGGRRGVVLKGRLRRCCSLTFGVGLRGGASRNNRLPLRAAQHDQRGELTHLPQIKQLPARRRSQTDPQLASAPLANQLDRQKKRAAAAAAQRRRGLWRRPSLLQVHKLTPG